MLTLTSRKDSGNTVKPVLRGHLRDKEKMALYDRRPLSLKKGLIHIKISMTEQEKGDFLIQVQSAKCILTN
jgi:hypothetical protein